MDWWIFKLQKSKTLKISSGIQWKYQILPGSGSRSKNGSGSGSGSSQKVPDPRILIRIQIRIQHTASWLHSCITKAKKRSPILANVANISLFTSITSFWLIERHSARNSNMVKALSSFALKILHKRLVTTYKFDYGIPGLSVFVSVVGLNRRDV